ncbi:Licodione synthase [Camellia lanceoleosa]|uniref:Licodione synthase n=1 Tax=Camellia lanceoleosa TaxID=1840588 RepID=A0ACC0F3I4_9ERIC|nr:Licodione synthase [Camellia lanceoleosa]
MFDLISIATLFFVIISTTLLLLSINHFKKPPHLRLRLSLPPTPFALPIIGHLHLLGPIIHRSFHDLSSRYGPLFHLRLGSVPCFVVSTPELAKEFLLTHELKFSSRRDSIAIQRLTYDSAFAFAPYGPYWKFLKKLCTCDLLGARSINHFLPIRTREVHCFVRLLIDKAVACEPVNITKELSTLANNIISQMMIGVRCSGTTGEAEEATTLAREVTKIFGEFNVSDFMWVFRNFDLQGFSKRVEDIYTRYDALLERIITNREEVREKNVQERKLGVGEGRHVKDFLDLLLDVLEADHSEIKFSRDNIKGLILCFEWKVVNQSGDVMNGDGALDMTEQPGMTAPRAHDLVCMPIPRIDQLYALLDP